MAWLFPWLLLLHVLAAIAGLGPSFTFPVIGAMGGGEPQHANFAIRVSHALATRLVYPIGLTLPVTGVAMILVTGVNLAAREFYWLDLAIVIYTVTMGYSLLVQRNLINRVIALTSAPPPPGASGPPPEVTALVGRISRGGGLSTVGLVAIIALMVIKPTI